MQVETALGDVVDRVTILLLKRARIRDAEKVLNIERELLTLHAAWANEGHPAMVELEVWGELRTVNERLWDVEDALREHEREQDFGRDFVELARSVYKLNDRRAALKRAINLELGSNLIEEKSYAPTTAENH